MSGAGNRFVLLDAREHPPVASAAELARGLCADARAEWSGACADGVLLLEPAEASGDTRLVIYNADGSRPEACGNGLRCVGRYLADEAPRRNTFEVETDSGPRPVRVEAGAVRVGLGRGRTRRATVELAGERRAATLVDLGNPHCVLFVEEPRRAPLERWGRALQEHALFPAGVNVELAVRRRGAAGPGARARVFERGVGETRACGTGAAAVALACEERFGARLPLHVELPGGELVVTRDHEGELWLAGPVVVHGTYVLADPLPTRTSGTPH